MTTQTNKKIIELKNKFRILKDWNIKLESNSIYKGQVNFNLKNKKVVIYDWEKESDTPKDFFLHEILHIGFIASNTREKEELFIQDLCKIFSLQRQEQKQECEQIIKENIIEDKQVIAETPEYKFAWGVLNDKLKRILKEIEKNL